MALIPIQNPSLTGTALAYAAAANGDTFINNGRTMLSVKNTDGSSHIVTITSVVNCSQNFNHNPAITVPATTGLVLIGPFPTDRFNDVNSQVAVAYAALTGMSVAAFST